MTIILKYISLQNVLLGLTEVKAVDLSFIRVDLEKRLRLDKIPEPLGFEGHFLSPFGLLGKSAYLDLYYRVFLQAEAAGELEAALHTAEIRGQSLEWFETIETGHFRLSKTAAAQVAPVLRGMAAESEIAIAAHLSGESTPRRPSWQKPMALEDAGDLLHGVWFEPNQLIDFLNRAGIRHPFGAVELAEPGPGVKDRAQDIIFAEFISPAIENSASRESEKKAIDVMDLDLTQSVPKSLISHVDSYTPKTHDAFIRNAYGVALLKGINPLSEFYEEVWIKLIDAHDKNRDSFINVEKFISGEGFVIKDKHPGYRFDKTLLRARYRNWEYKRPDSPFFKGKTLPQPEIEERDSNSTNN